MEWEIVVEIAKGAVGAIGGALLKGLIPDSTVEDIKTAITLATEYIEAYTKQQIQENDILEIVSQMQGCIGNILDWDDRTTAEKPNYVFLLQNAITSSDSGLHEARNLGLSAILAYATAVSVSIMAKARYMQMYPSDVSKNEIRKLVSDAKAYISGVVPPYVESLRPENRLSVADAPCEWVAGDDGQSAYGQCHWTLDGQDVTFYDGIEQDDGYIDDLIKKERDDLTAYRNDFIQKVQVLCEQAMAQWDVGVQQLG